MDFKIGNNVVCKYTLVTNNRKDNDISGKQVHFSEGKSYKVVDYKVVDGEWCYILHSELSNNCHIPEKRIKSWFYTQKELRKLKLKEIENG